MENGKYYVLANGNNLYEGLTKEQIFAAIAEATGETPTDVDAAFITKIKEQNKNQPIKFWFGTTAEYNALQSYEPNCFYVFSDSDELNDILQAAENAAEAKVAEFCPPKNSVLVSNDSGIGSGATINIDNLSLYTVFILETSQGNIVATKTYSDLLGGCWFIHGQTFLPFSYETGNTLCATIQFLANNGAYQSSFALVSRLNGTVEPVAVLIKKVIGVY